MLNKILLSLAGIALVSTIAIGATMAYFSDTESSVDNTFSAGTLDLNVDGEDAMVPFVVSNMAPGETKGSPTYTIKNVGTLPGEVTLKVKNVKTNENNLIEPEIAAGDGASTRLDPDGFTIASGLGELLDQLYLRFWVDDTPGQRPAPFDWQDKYWSGYPDESDTYKLPVDTDLMDSHNIVLQPGESMYMGAVAQFISDTDTPYGWILDGVLNNATMDDDVKFDIEVGLKQIVTP